jgi:hypothetical protein
MAVQRARALIRDAFDPEYGRDIPREIYMPGGADTPYGPYIDQ